jgi:hypothetical protein
MREKIDQFVDEMEVEVLMADGFDEALIALATQFNTHLAVYDSEKCIEILMERDGMDREEAEEFFSYNVTGGYHGELTPLFTVTLPED